MEDLDDFNKLTESEMASIDRITRTPGMMGGKACIRGIRVTVGMIVGEIAVGTTPDELLASFPYIERDDITQALRYASWLASEYIIELPSTYVLTKNRADL